MQVYFEPSPQMIASSAIALGFFDGVHPGHKVVIEKAVAEAKRLGALAGVVTFRDHPRGLTRGQAPLLLSVIEERLSLFEELGVDFALVLTFSEELCKLSPREYVQNILVDSLGARSISVGHNHHFGRDREGNAELLAAYGRERDFVVHAADMVYVDGLEVSSTRIRDLIIGKNLELATRLLSRPFNLRGVVVEGDKRGRTLGFPTANVNPAFNQLVPPSGVYAGMAYVVGEGDGGAKEGARHNCVINIGVRPTFKNPETGASGDPIVTIESHLLDFDGDLYGKILKVEFHKHLRDEKKFDGLASLKQQIESDCRMAREYLPKAMPKTA